MRRENYTLFGHTPYSGWKNETKNKTKKNKKASPSRNSCLMASLWACRTHHPCNLAWAGDSKRTRAIQALVVLRRPLTREMCLYVFKVKCSFGSSVEICRQLYIRSHVGKMGRGSRTKTFRDKIKPWACYWMIGHSPIRCQASFCSKNDVRTENKNNKKEGPSVRPVKHHKTCGRASLLWKRVLSRTSKTQQTNFPLVIWPECDTRVRLFKWMFGKTVPTQKKKKKGLTVMEPNAFECCLSSRGLNCPNSFRSWYRLAFVAEKGKKMKCVLMCKHLHSCYSTDTHCCSPLLCLRKAFTAVVCMYT